MLPSLVHLLLIAAFSGAAFYLGRRQVKDMAAASGARPHSLEHYYGWYAALWLAIPALVLFILWNISDHWWMHRSVIDMLPAEAAQASAEQQVFFVQRIADIAQLKNSHVGFGDATWMTPLAERYRSMMVMSSWILFAGLCALMGSLFLYMRGRLVPSLRARERVEIIVNLALRLASLVAILVTITILLSVLFEAVRFFDRVPFWEFLFGTQWSPQMAIRADQAGSSGSFGAVPLFTGTLLITAIAMVVAVPLGLMAAVYMAEYASPRLRSWAKPILEVLAGVPTVVYGYFAAITVAPAIRAFGQSIGLDVASESALAAGLVMGVMIIPFVSSLSDDVINAVPQALRDAGYALGATQAEVITRIVLPAATPGIMGAVLLAVSRAIGETMIVVMAAGLAANLTLNPFDSVTTVTAQIVSLLVGDQEFDSPKTLAAFALGLTLFVITMILNLIALRIVKNYRRKYA